MARVSRRPGSRSRALSPALAALALCALLVSPCRALAAQSTVSWDPAPEETVAGYKVYLAPAGQGFAAPVDVGAATSHTLTGLEPARVYRVAVAAYDVFAQEGSLSEELLFTAPDADATDADGDGLPDVLEQAGCTDPGDDDTDDDGLADGAEDADRDGARDGAETSPCAADTDGDGLQDGTESGVTLAAAVVGTDPATFRPDLDPATATDPLAVDTDGDGVADGAEDADRNGRVDAGETDPLTPDNPLLFSDDFTDGGPAGDPSWRRVSGGWTVTPGKSYASSPNLRNLTLAAATAVGDFSSGRIETRVKLTGGGTGTPNAEVVFDYRDAGHFRYVRLTPSGVSLGQVGATVGDGPGAKATRSRRVLLERWNRLRIDIERGSAVRVYLGAATVPALTYRFRDPLSGRIGLRTTRARTLFDDFAVHSSAVLP